MIKLTQADFTGYATKGLDNDMWLDILFKILGTTDGNIIGRIAPNISKLHDFFVEVVFESDYVELIGFKLENNLANDRKTLYIKYNAVSRNTNGSIIRSVWEAIKEIEI